MNPDTKSAGPATGFPTRHATPIAAAIWRHALPAAWRDATEVPLYLEHHREYEICAERTVGYDADDAPCFVAHRFVLTTPASDDDEEYYARITHAEEMAAWRLRDNRWLLYRRIDAGNCDAPRAFYSFSPDMPR